jgi:3-hydroxyisobutyrate dehydrogenase-like beta-hydroxyacid dehydrogenase
MTDTKATHPVSGLATATASPSTSVTTILVLGLGTMGAGMARNLAKAGFRVLGWNRSPERAEALRTSGVEPVTSLTEAASQADLVWAVLADDAALRTVALGEHGGEHGAGVLASMRRGSIFVDSGTTSLELTRSLHGACLERGVEMLDAPVTGSKLGAENGALTFMVGGATEVIERARPAFTAMGKGLVHVGGEVGRGQAAKLCLNMTQAVVLEGVLEGYALAQRLGVPITKLSEIFEQSAGRTGVGVFKTPYLLRGELEPHFRLALMLKDLRLALGEAKARDADLPLAQAVARVYDEAVEAGWGDLDFLATSLAVERHAGVRFKDG